MQPAYTLHPRRFRNGHLGFQRFGVLEVLDHREVPSQHLRSYIALFRLLPNRISDKAPDIGCHVLP